MTTPAEMNERASRILDYATFCGFQHCDSVTLELWTLRKPLGVHPEGSTITRQTLERHLFNPTKSP